MLVKKDRDDSIKDDTKWGMKCLLKQTLDDEKRRSGREIYIIYRDMTIDIDYLQKRLTPQNFLKNIKLVDNICVIMSKHSAQTIDYKGSLHHRNS